MSRARRGHGPPEGGLGKSTSAALLSAEIAELRLEWTVVVEDPDVYRHVTARWPADTLSLRLVGATHGAHARYRAIGSIRTNE